MKKFHLIIDIASCQDCNCCFLACKDEYIDNEWPGYSAAQPLHGQRWMNILRSERGTYPIADVGFVPQPCMHCDAAPCVAAGDRAVTKRKDGAVLIDPIKARGNKKLVESCPYKAIWWNEEKQVAQKCTGCAHLLDSGWKEPRCVQACPTGALGFAYVDDSEIKDMVSLQGLEIFHPEYGTKPNVFYKNLHRYTKCFIGGSIAVQKSSGEECLPGAKITVFSGSTEVGEAVSDTYGEFKIDRLEPNSGPYRIDISVDGSIQSIKISSLPRSINLGVIVVGQRAMAGVGTR